MAYIAMAPSSFEGRKVGSGQCVAYVQKAARAPNSGLWKQGIKVLTAGHGAIVRGTVIATMVHGTYPNRPHGNHAAIYISHDPGGIWVYDQWLGQPVHQRYIRNHGGTGNPSNDADMFYVVD
jgi:hypothetical protein